MTDLDAYRAAQFLIRQRDDPEMFAAHRVDDMIVKGDGMGEAAWKRILAAIRDLQRAKPWEGQRMQ